MTSLRRNIAGQRVFFGMVNATTGGPLAGATVTINRGLDGAAQAAVTGTVTELGGGQYRFDPSQADTDGDFVGYHMTATNAVPVSANFVTIGYDPRKAFLDVNLETWLGVAPLALAAQRVQVDALNTVAANVVGWHGVPPLVLDAQRVQTLALGVPASVSTFDPTGAVPASPVPGTYDDHFRQSLNGTLKVADVTNDVGGKVLGGGASTITGVGARAQDEFGAQVASDTELKNQHTTTKTHVTNEHVTTRGGTVTLNATQNYNNAGQTSVLPSNVGQLNGNAGAAAKLEESYKAVVTFVCAAGGSTTSVVFSSTNPAFTVNDQPNGKIITFADDTITPSLRGQSTDITNFDNGTKTATVTALTTAPAANDTGVIT